MIIDAHQHFWRVGRGDYGWLTPAVGPIYRDFMPEDLAPTLARLGIDGTILVQAAPTVAETRFMLEIASRWDTAKGVVGWVDFEDPEAGALMAELRSSGPLVGVRPMMQDIPDDDWMLRPDLDRAFQSVTALGLVFDALVFPRHLRRLLSLLERHPHLRTVIDHGAKPEIRSRAFADWAQGMSALARQTTACCKISGLVTEAGATWNDESLKPYVDHLLASFGPERLIWGSDWPVCTLTASYEAWFEATQRLLAGLSTGERAAVMGGNAERVYRLAGGRP
jgi:L-fuconolactonase